MKGEYDMKKKFSSTLSITLAGLLAVGSIGMTPMTAYAADQGDVIYFEAGRYSELSLVKSNATLDGSTYQLSDPVFDPDTIFDVTTVGSVDAGDGYKFVWVDENNKVLDPTTDTMAQITTNAGRGTLTASRVGLTYNISIVKPSGAQFVDDEYASQAPTTKEYGKDLKKIPAQKMVGSEFTGYKAIVYDTDGTTVLKSANIDADADAAKQSSAIDGLFKDVTYDTTKTVTVAVPAQILSIQRA